MNPFVCVLVGLAAMGGLFALLAGLTAAFIWLQRRYRGMRWLMPAILLIAILACVYPLGCEICRMFGWN